MYCCVVGISCVSLGLGELSICTCELDRSIFVVVLPVLKADAAG